MLEMERRKLQEAAANGNYVCICVNEDGAPVQSISIPWESDTSAYNMRMPNVSLAAADLQNPEIMEELRHCKLTGMHIHTALEHYDFIAEFQDLRLLMIAGGGQIRDLEFVRNHPDLFMFYLEDAELDSLAPLIEEFNTSFDAGNRLPGKCIGFYHCKVTDTSALQNDAHFITSELLIWPCEGDQRDRWRILQERRPGIFRFYE